jgi:hypothetical protein
VGESKQEKQRSLNSYAKTLTARNIKELEGTQRAAITTLRSDRIYPENHIDLSNCTVYRIGRRVGEDKLGDEGLAAFSPFVNGKRFPSGTSGFLYFHRGQGHILGASVRFRITQGATAESFIAGQDLEIREGLPWGIAFLQIVRFYKPFLLLLLQDGLVTKEDVQFAEDVAKNSDIKQFHSSSIPLVEKITDPFIWDMGRKTLRLHVLDSQKRELMVYRTFQSLLEDEALCPGKDRTSNPGFLSYSLPSTRSMSSPVCTYRLQKKRGCKIQYPTFEGLRTYPETT